MGTTYRKNYNTKVTPQDQAIPGRENEMVTNNAGGVTFKLDNWARLNRFLIMGSETNTYYVGSKKLTIENARVIKGLIEIDGKKVVDQVVAISAEGRASSNDPALFVLAMCAGLGDAETKKYALSRLSEIARIGTHLFHFVEFVTGFRGWGRGLRNAVAEWYQTKEVRDLAYQVAKYQSRDGWSHRDLLRLSHANPIGDDMNTIFAWITHGVGGEFKSVSGEVKKAFPETLSDIKSIPMLWATEMVKNAKNDADVVKLITDFNIPREVIPTDKLTKSVYEAMLPNMPMTALIRNLGNLSKNGILEIGNFDEINMVVDKITDENLLKRARVHPIQILAALKTYASGHGFKGAGEWKVVPQIVDALDKAFHLSFKFVNPTGKRILLALDVSGSMNSNSINGLPMLSARVGSAAMAMVTMRVERDVSIVGFASGGRGWNDAVLTSLNVTPQMGLKEVIREVSRLPFGGTDCALPMIWAKENKKDYDAIVILTDNETWHGKIHPSQALEQYEKFIGHNVKLIVVGMASNGFTIADPNQPNQLDIVGFDSASPAIMSEFIMGNL